MWIYQDNWVKAKFMIRRLRRETIKDVWKKIELELQRIENDY